MDYRFLLPQLLLLLPPRHVVDSRTVVGGVAGLRLPLLQGPPFRLVAADVDDEHRRKQSPLPSTQSDPGLPFEQCFVENPYVPVPQLPRRPA